MTIEYSGPDSHSRIFNESNDRSWEDVIEDDYGPDEAGEYDIIATAVEEDGSESQEEFESFVFDDETPDLIEDYPEDGEFIDEDSPVIDVGFEDELSGLANASIEFDGETVYLDEDDIGETSEVLLELEAEDLDDDSYDFDVWAEDRAGNDDSDTWSFTVDTLTPDPEDYELDPSSGLHEVDLGDDFDIEITVEPSEDHESEIEALCLIDGDEEDSDGREEFEEEEEVEFECSIPDDYMDQSVEFEFELVDQAGNDWVSDYHVYELDATPPSVEYFESSINISVFNDDFEVEYLASDLSGVQNVEYYLNDDPGQGEGTSFSEDEGEFYVDTSDLDTGNNTVYLRAQDEFDRWSTASSIDFEYRPDQSPELSIDIIDELELEAGETENLDLGVENTGDMFIPQGEIAASYDMFNETQNYADLLPGDRIDTSFEIEASEDDIGEHELSLEFSTVDVTETVELIINPNEEGREDIDGQLDAYNDEYQTLSEDFEDLKDGGLSEERSDRLETDISSFEAALNEAEESTENEDYFEAHNLVDELSAEMQQSQDTFAEVEEEHQVSVRNRRVIMVVLGLFAVLIGSIIYVFYNEEYELDIPGLDELMPDSESTSAGIEDSESIVDKLKSKIEDLRGPDDSEPVYEFK